MAVNAEGILEIVDGIDQKHTDGHKRLRETLSTLADRLDRVEEAERRLAAGHLANEKSIEGLATTPLDATKLVLSPKIVATIVAAALSVFGGMWAANAGLRSDVRDILTRMAADQRVADANAKLIEANNSTIRNALEANTREFKDSIREVQNQQKLLTLQYNELNDKITRLSAARER